MADDRIEPDKTYTELRVGGLLVGATLADLVQRIQALEAQLRRAPAQEPRRKKWSDQ